MKFREFIGPNEFSLIKARIESRRKVLKEALYSTMPDDRFSLPVSVTNVLNVIPPKYHARVLRWIMTEGLRHALIRRRAFANSVQKYISQKTGSPVEVPQDALFSDVARQEIPALGQFSKEIDQQWLDRYEPDVIPLVDRSQDETKITNINLQDINAHLLQQGLKPLYFGGPDGLIEYLERGDWRSPEDYHINSRFNKQGHDLSLDPDVPPDQAGLWEDPETGRKMYCFGLDPTHGVGSGEEREHKHSCGFQPPSGSSFWHHFIRMAREESVDIAKSIVEKIEAGVPYEEFGNEELDWLKQRIENKEISEKNLSSRDALLKDVVAVVQRGESGTQQVRGDDEDYISAKAAAKESLRLLLSKTPHEDPYTDERVDPHTKMVRSLGHSPDGSVPPATISIMGTQAFNLADLFPKLETPQEIEKAATYLVNLMFNDETRRVAPYINFWRGSKKVYFRDIGLNGMISPEPGDLGRVAMRKQQIVKDSEDKNLPKTLMSQGYVPTQDPKSKHGKRALTMKHPNGDSLTIYRQPFKTPEGKSSHTWMIVEDEGGPVEVDFNGQPMEIGRHSLMNSLLRSEKTIFTVPGLEIEDLANTSSKPLDLEKMKQAGYRPMGNMDWDQLENSERRVATIVEPTTGDKKKIMRLAAGQPWMDMAPADNRDVRLQEKLGLGYQVEYLDPEHKYAVLFNPNTDEEQLMKRKVMPNQEDVWQYVTPVDRHAKKENPYLTGLFTKVNTQAGQSRRVAGHTEEAKVKWQDYLDHPEKFGEPPRDAASPFPKAVTWGASAVRDAPPDHNPKDYLSAGMEVLLNNIDSVAFRHGTFQQEPGEDIFKLLAAAGYNDKQIQFLLAALKKTLTGKTTAGKPLGIEPNDGSQLWTDPNGFAPPAYEAILKNGLLWRKRKAASAIKRATQLAADPRQRARGEGGAADNDETGGSFEDMITSREESPEDAADRELQALLAQDPDAEFNFGGSEEGEGDDWNQGWERIEDDPDEEIGRADTQEEDPDLADFNIEPTIGGGGPAGALDKAISGGLEGDKEEDEYKYGQGRKQASTQRRKRTSLGSVDLGTDVQFGRKRTDPLAGMNIPMYQQGQRQQAPVKAKPPNPFALRGEETPQERTKKKPPNPFAEGTVLRGYQQWLAETGPYDPRVSRLKDRTFNVWGAPPEGKVPQKSIDGEADDSKKYPTGKESNGRRNRNKA